MNNLIYKELKISINKFFYVWPFVLALLLFIPHWIFTIVFSYFFWISVTTIYAAYNAEEDLSFSYMLPVAKKDIAKSKVYAFFILESLHIFTGILMVIVHNLLYGSYNFFLDANFAFFGIILIMYSIFNIIFLPLYFKTAYYFGKPVTYASIAAAIFAFIIEYSAIKFESFRTIVEGDISSQLIVLVVGIIFTIVISFIATKRSVINFERIK